MTSTLGSCILKFLRRTTALALPVVPLLAISTPPAQGQTYTVLFDFGGKHGISPAAGLIGDANGNLYSTTQAGGFPGTVSTVAGRYSGSTETAKRGCCTALPAERTEVFPVLV